MTLSVGAERRTQRLDGVAEEVIVATVVSPSEPRTVGGLYWGYSTRLAPSLSSALLDCPFQVCEQPRRNKKVGFLGAMHWHSGWEQTEVTGFW